MKKKTHKKTIIIVVVILIVLAAIFAFFKMKSNNSGADSTALTDGGVLVQPLEIQDMSTSISATGTVESQNVYQVTTETTCKVKELPVALGDHVEVGQTLCVFDDVELREQIKALESQIATSEQQSAKQREVAQRGVAEAQANAAAQINHAGTALAEAQGACDRAYQAYSDALVAQQIKKDAYDTAQSVADAAQQKLDDLEKETGFKDEAAIGDAKKELEAAQQKAADANTELQSANSECDAAESAYYSAQSQVTTSQEGVEDAQRQGASTIQSAQDSVDTANMTGSGTSDPKAQLEKLYRQLENTTVKATQAGVITKMSVSKGAVANGAVMQIDDDKNLKVKVGIKEKDILSVKDGMEATVVSSAIPGEENTGVINKVINFASSSSGTGTEAAAGGSAGASATNYSAEININPGTSLLLGMTVKVEIVTKNLGKQLAVAYDNIGTDDNGDSYIYRAKQKDDGTYVVEKVIVVVGESNEFYTAISGKGLAEGDLIILMPDTVTEGQTIEINNPMESMLEGLDEYSASETEQK